MLSIVTFSVETIPDLSPRAIQVLHMVELVCVVIFTIEYILRIYVADSKPKFIFSFFGLIDLLAILPFYLSFGIDLRSLRALRFVRLFRLYLASLNKRNNLTDRLGPCDLLDYFAYSNLQDITEQ